jgi:large subunit ribosomal protein L13
MVFRMDIRSGPRVERVEYFSRSLFPFGVFMQTYSIKRKDIDRKWYVVDAADMVLGRLATEISRRLRGKHKTDFTPHMDNGDFIIVINAEKVRITGRKLEQKTYFRHSGYPGGAREVRMDKVMQTRPERIIEHAVKGMLPHNTLGRHQLTKLKIYCGPEHPHKAQQPEPIAL